MKKKRQPVKESLEKKTINMGNPKVILTLIMQDTRQTKTNDTARDDPPMNKWCSEP